MPGVLNKFFLQASTKNWAFLEKINGLLFFRLDNREPLECLQCLPS